MTIERQDLEALEPFVQKMAVEFQERNLRRSGEGNITMRLGHLDLLKGFTVEDMCGHLWSVRRVEPNGYVHVHRENLHRKPGEPKYITRLWSPEQRVRVPEND